MINGRSRLYLNKINEIEEVVYKMHDGVTFEKPAYTFKTKEVVHIEKENMY